ncbi:HEAT repeat domain-containing protein, partial [Candidatus Woesearchaeota archaeon]|nr:HEAT repeat domain-containing protein [Candidatus Woesearchaeota archaeon]
RQLGEASALSKYLSEDRVNLVIALMRIGETKDSLEFIRGLFIDEGLIFSSYKNHILFRDVVNALPENDPYIDYDLLKKALPEGFVRDEEVIEDSTTVVTKRWMEILEEKSKGIREEVVDVTPVTETLRSNVVYVASNLMGQEPIVIEIASRWRAGMIDDLEAALSESGVEEPAKVAEEVRFALTSGTVAARVSADGHINPGVVASMIGDPVTSIDAEDEFVAEWKPKLLEAMVWETEGNLLGFASEDVKATYQDELADAETRRLFRQGWSGKKNEWLWFLKPRPRGEFLSRYDKVRGDILEAGEKAAAGFDTLLNTLIYDLDNSNRIKAAEELAKVGDASVGGVLIKEAQDSRNSPGIRASILRTIAQIGQRDVFDDEVSIGLRNIARSPYNLNIYNLAINALGVMKYGDFFEKGTSVEFLISELRVHEYEKNPIIWALGDLGDERALPALERLASEGKANRFTNEQTAAVDAIAKIGGNRALYFLFETWAGGDFDAKQHARWAIWAYGDQVVDRVIEKLNDKEYLGRANYLEEELIDALGKIEYENEDRKRKAASKLVDLLERDDVNHETINTALNALGEGVVDILIDNLKSPKFDSSIKRNRILQAILQIGEIKTTQEIVIPTMVDAFKEKELRNRAGLILAKIGMPAYEPVKEMITQDADQDKIEKTVLTLSMIDAMNAKEEGTVSSIFFGDREEPLQKWILYKLLLQHGLGDRKRVYREEAYKLYYDELGGREDDLERELGTILELFETPSLKRDDMLLDLIDRKASKLEQANRIASFLSKNSGGVDELDMFPVDEQDIISEVPVSVFAREIVRAYNREKRIELLKLLIGISDKFDTGVYETIEIGGRPRVGYSTYKIKDKDEAAKFRNSIFSASETEFNSFIEFLMKGNGGVFDPITVADQKQMDDFLNEVFNFFVPETEVTGITRERISIAFHTIFQTYSPDRRTAIFITLLNLKEKLKDASMGEKYKLFLSSLGAAGVKAGQFLSEQEGIIESAELRDSLGQLKEAVKPFSKQEAFEVINTNRLENEVAALGTRLGSGSIKQVHLATLEDGSEVAIKIKRPGLDDLLDEDFKVLVTVVNELKKTGMEIPDIVDFVREGIEKESDFRNEVEAAALIGNLGYKSPEEKHYNVKFAKILESNKDMIVEEAVKGVSFSLLMQMMEHKEDILLEDAELKREVMSNLGFEESQIDTILSLDKSDIEKLLSFDVNEISDILLDHIFYQIFDAGLFHGDPHGGNFMITPNGEIYIIDLGDIGKLEANERRALSGVVIGISRQDVEYTLLNVDKILGSRQSEEIKNSITYIINSDKPVIEKMKDLWITVSNKAKGPGKDSFNSAMKTLAKVDYLIRLSGKDEKFFRRHGVGLANYYDLTAAKVKQYFGMVESAPELEDVKEELTGEEGEKEKGEVEDKVISLLEKGYMVAGITGRGVNRKNPMYEESEKGILEIGEAAVPYLLRYLESEQVHSPYIASTLAKIGGESVLELMKQRVNSELYHVSNAAIEVIGKIGSEEEFPILRDALLDGGWRYETGTVIDAMENMDDKRTFGVVIEFLVSDHARYMTSPVLKSKIRNLLLKMGDEELSEMQATYDGLEPVKPDDVEYVKNRIRMIIGHDYYSELAQEEYFSKIYFTPRGEHAGRDLIQDVIETLTKRNEVKQKILEALKASEGSAEIIEEIDKLRTYQEEVYSEGKGALLKYGTEIVPALLEASEYDDMNKEVLFGLLGDIGDSRALPLLIRNLDNARYRGIVAQALSKIGDEQAIKPMVDYLVKNMFYLRELRRPIISFGDKSLPYLKEAISDKKVDEHHVNDIEKMIDEIESMAPEERLQERGESQEALTSLASRILIVMAEELERYVEGGDVGGLTPIQQEFLDELLEQGKITQNEYKQALETGQMPFIAAGEGEVAVPGEGVGYEEVGLVGVEELPEAQRTEIEYHLDTLKYGDLDSRLRASQKLWEIGEGSVPFIISALNEESIPKSIGVRILGFIGGARARDVIVRYISDPNYNVRAEVAGALGRIKDPDSIEILIGLRNDDSDYVRIVAGNALGEIGAPALERLHQLMGESESDVRFALVPLRFISDDSSIPYLVESYKYENTDIRNEIREFFILGSEKRINTLVSYLEVDKLTPYALELVEDFGKKEAVEPLIRLLGHQDSEVRLKAAKILVESQDPRVIEPLSEAFNEPAIAEGLALRFVTRIVSEDDFMRFSSEFESRPEKTRVALLKAFSDAYIFQKRLALNFLQKQYESENENIRAAAITGLTKLDKEGETLLRGLSDKSTKVRAASLEAYIEANQYDIEDRHIDLLVDHLRGKGVEVGEVAVRWLATLSKYDILKNQFKGDELDNEIALVLLENGDDNYRSYVDQLLKDSNRRKRTIDVIGKLNLIEHAPQLFGLLDTEESSLSIDALTNMDGEPILEKVVQLLDHKEPKVRRFAAEKILEQSSYLKDVVSNGEELINTVQKMHNEGLQLRDTVELVERLALVSPEMFTPAVMDDLSSIYGDRLRYARFFVSGRKEGLEILETEVQREFKSRVLEGKKEIVIVHNFQDGIGDELIRVTTLVESLLDANPELKIKIFTARPYLYDSHERLEVDSLFGLLGEQTSGYDMVINFEGPPNQRTNQWSNIASRIISNSIDTVVLQNQGSHDIHMLMGGLEVDLEFSGNVYLTSYRFLAEMGVPFKIEEESRNSIIVNKEGEFTEQWWKDNELENKKVVALNLFGGTIKEKGITNREEFREIVNDLIKQGYHVLVLPNHQE